MVNIFNKYNYKKHLLIIFLGMTLIID